MLRLGLSHHFRKFSRISSKLSIPLSSPLTSFPRRSFNSYSTNSTFVSSYHQISNTDIKEFLTRIGLEYKETNSGFTVRYCPLCPKPHYEERTNLYTLGFKANSGVFHCFRCGVSGSWYDFKNLVTGSNLHVESMQPAEAPLPSSEDHAVRVQNLIEQKYPSIVDYLRDVRGLSSEVLQKYNVGVGPKVFRNLETEESLELPCVFFPMYFSKGSESYLARVKIRAIYKENKQYMKMHPTGGGFGFFGLNIVPNGIKTIVITEGEYDALTFHRRQDFMRCRFRTRLLICRSSFCPGLSSSKGLICGLMTTLLAEKQP